MAIPGNEQPVEVGKQRKVASEITDTRRYLPLRGPTSSSCGGLRPLAEAFFALRA